MSIVAVLVLALSCLGLGAVAGRHWGAGTWKREFARAATAIAALRADVARLPHPAEPGTELTLTALKTRPDSQPISGM